MGPDDFFEDWWSEHGTASPMKALCNEAYMEGYEDGTQMESRAKDRLCESLRDQLYAHVSKMNSPPRLMEDVDRIAALEERLGKAMHLLYRAEPAGSQLGWGTWCDERRELCGAPSQSGIAVVSDKGEAR